MTTTGKSFPKIILKMDEDGDDLKSQLAVNTIKKTDAKGRKEGRGHREGDGEGKTS